MNGFFNQLGCTVLEQWKRANFSLASFPEIARRALHERPPTEHVDLTALIRGFLCDDDQPFQTMSGFGQPELVVYNHRRFFIQVLFWLEGTTDIHQHEFSGAFHVLKGSSIHAHYEFEKPHSVTPHLRLGDVRMKRIELLETGRTVSIISGPRGAHSLFHLDTPSVTVVVRTQHDPGTGPQFNYLPPYVAIDPTFHDELTLRRTQLFDVLEQIEAPNYAELMLESITTLDFESGFFLLQQGMGYLRDLGEWKPTLAAFKKKHGKLAAGVEITLAEGVRRNAIKEMRRTITDPEHRFFLAVLMNVATRADVLGLVAQRFPATKPQETILRWAEELIEQTPFGVAILDADFPQNLGIVVQDQAELFIAALHHFLDGAKTTPASLRSLSAAKVKRLHAAFVASSLRVLVA